MRRGGSEKIVGVGVGVGVGTGSRVAMEDGNQVAVLGWRRVWSRMGTGREEEEENEVWIPAKTVREPTATKSLLWEGQNRARGEVPDTLRLRSTDLTLR